MRSWRAFFIRGRWAILAATLVSLAIAACGSSGDDVDVGDPGAAAALLEGEGIEDLPDPLRENIEQANQIIDGGRAVLEEKLAELRGFPVVVNQWASWLGGPSESEFPILQAATAEHASEVAFLGIDSLDDREDAREFLEEELSLPYPSIFDEDGEAKRFLRGGEIAPNTFFIDERGDLVHIFPGQYQSEEQLEAQIRRFLLTE